MSRRTIAIAPDGVITFIYADELAGLIAEGKAETRRASHVEPAPGGWTADLSPIGGPTLGPFGLRQAALDAEVLWLEGKLATL
jgi:hypothetical protein